MLTYDLINKNKRESWFLIFAFLIIIAGLGYAFSLRYNDPEILIIALIFSAASSLVSYYFADSITLALSGARQVDRQTNQELYRLVENLCIAAGLPAPKIYIIEDSAPNAFATGRDPEHAAVCVTSGILQKLDKPELEGVIAHELSHIGNYDIRVMTLVVVLVGTVTLLADWFLRASFLGGAGSRRGRDRDNNGITTAIAIAGLLLAVLSPVIATLIKLAVSRQREYLADASGALLTRYPEGLARALEKISADTEPLEAANKATAHLYIVNPLKEHQGKSSVGWFASLFNTHPPIQDRIARLKNMNM